MIQFFSETNGKLMKLTADQLSTSALNWINVEAPSHTEIDEIADRCHVSTYDLESILDDQENSRVVFDKHNDDSVTLLLQYPKYETSPLGYLTYNTFPILFILQEHYIVTVSNHPATFIQDFIMDQNRHARIMEQEQFIARMTWYIAHEYVVGLNRIADEMDVLERELTSATQNEQIYKIMAMQKTMIEFQQSLSQNGPIINQMQSNEHHFESDKMQEIAAHTISENQKALSIANTLSQVLEQYSNMFSAVVSNNLNDVMKVLTSITLILTIPTIISGIYGMNVALPGAQIASAFCGLSIITIFICWLTYVLLKRHKYL